MIIPDITFRYPGQAPDKGLKAVSIEIAPGTTTGKYLYSILFIRSFFCVIFNAGGSMQQSLVQLDREKLP